MRDCGNLKRKLDKWKHSLNLYKNRKCRDRINELKENLICKPSQSVPTKWYATELAEIKNQKGPGYENFIKT